jgi:hypothetical protein
VRIKEEELVESLRTGQELVLRLGDAEERGEELVGYQECWGELQERDERLREALVVREGEVGGLRIEVGELAGEKRELESESGLFFGKFEELKNSNLELEQNWRELANVENKREWFLGNLDTLHKMLRAENEILSINR